MALLVIVLASFLLFVVVAVLLALAHAAERRELRRLSLRPPGRPFRVLPVALAFDPERSVIWDTQLPPLQMVCAGGRRGVTSERLYRAYQESAQHYPELYDGASFDQWVTFLEQAGLIATDGDKVIITPVGYRFVKYRVSTGALTQA